MPQKEPHNLSGIYYRFQNPETKKWENWCFEDLPESEQDRILNTKDIESIKNLAKMLGKTIIDLGEKFQIFTT